MIADYYYGQSLVQSLLDHGIGHVALTDWKSAKLDMRDFEIDNYLAELIVPIDDLGGPVNLVGLCQGGWMSAVIAARESASRDSRVKSLGIANLLSKREEPDPRAPGSGLGFGWLPIAWKGSSLTSSPPSACRPAWPDPCRVRRSVLSRP